MDMQYRDYYLRRIPVNRLRPDPDQARKQFDEEALDELARSMRQVGVLQPLLVRRDDGEYRVIAGERRLRAAKMAGLSVLPCIICDCDSEQAAVASMVENLQRKDLNPFEQAEGIRRLMNLLSLTQEEAAKKLGKAQSSVANKLRLLALSESLRGRITEAGLTERHARALLTAPESERDAILTYIIEHKLNVEAAERYIKLRMTPPRQPQKKPKIYFKDLRIFINTIDKSIRYLTSAGIRADAKKTEDDEYIFYSIKIPKSRPVRPADGGQKIG